MYLDILNLPCTTQTLSFLVKFFIYSEYFYI